MVEVQIESNAAVDDAMSARLAENWGWVLLRGILAILVGVITFAVPFVALQSFILLFAAYMLADGVVGIVAAVRAARARERWGWLVFEGLLNILVGLAALFYPGIAMLTFVLLMSAWALVSGGALLVAAFRLKKTHGRWLMVLGGVLSIAWGVLLFLAPLPGALVLTLWFGAYVLIFGILMVVLAIKLRGRRRRGDTVAETVQAAGA